MKIHGLVLSGLLLVGGAELFRARFSLCVSRGESMEPTFTPRALLVVDREAYRHRPPLRGDIVLARHGSEWIVKRVVGLPGETVEVRKGRLVINGSVSPEPYPTRPGPLHIKPGMLRPDRYALLGDNRNLGSEESVHAVVGLEQILGRVVWSLSLTWPGNNSLSFGQKGNSLSGPSAG